MPPLPEHSVVEAVAEILLSHDRSILGPTIAAHRDLTIQLTAQAPTPADEWLRVADELDISRQATPERLPRAVGSLLEETF